MNVSVADEIAQISIDRPHVVLVGAGASRAAFPEGEANGHRLPLMADFLEIVPVQGILADAGVECGGRNFEDVYSELFTDSSKAPVRERLESAVLDYFDALQLPETATLYDALVLSLRSKDVIATFNWDPFLIQAVRRHQNAAKSPRLIFLHGNVLDGYCPVDRIHGVRGSTCSSCGAQRIDVPLLYPIRQKRYSDNAAINSAWDNVKWAFENAFMVTVFGFGAPTSDVEAIALLQKAWGQPETRQLEQFEIIDIRPPEEVIKSWEGFIHTHHYEVHSDFRESWMAKHPRRTGEAWSNQYLMAARIATNPIPATRSLSELEQWFAPLIDAELKAASDGEQSPG